MSIRITTAVVPGTDNRLHLTDLAVAELWKHGWEPPAGKEYRVKYWDYDERTMTELHIPARTRQTTSLPTAEQLELVILQRIAARLDFTELPKLTGGLETGHAVVEAAGDAAEAILDILGGTQ